MERRLWAGGLSSCGGRGSAVALVRGVSVGHMAGEGCPSGPVPWSLWGACGLLLSTALAGDLGVVLGPLRLRLPRAYAAPGRGNREAG